jgi:hypothetical protein
MRKNSKNTFFLSLFLLVLGFQIQSSAQDIYSARGFWEESNKETYKTIKLKQAVGDAISEEEISYLLDFEDYLNNYYAKLSEVEKVLYQKMKVEWDRELTAPKRIEKQPEEFEWRGRDRAVNIGYGIYYGASLVAVAEINNVAAVGLPLITGGIWALGPIFNPNKYENIDRSILRASNAGKFLGLVYGGSLGLLVAGDNGDIGKAFLGFSTLGSIGLGELAFQMQKKKRFSEGHVELMRHYGLLGSYVGLSTVASAQAEHARIYGLSALIGGAAGLALGNIASKNYPYTKGDANYITSMSIIGSGIGFAISSEIALEAGGTGLLLIPAGLSVLGTTIGQRTTQGINLTNKQGSTINYATGGAALIGLGIASIVASERPSVFIGLPTTFALVTQQILFKRYKTQNLNFNLARKSTNGDIKYSLKFHPENYFVNQQLQSKATILNSYEQLSTPIVNFNLNF